MIGSWIRTEVFAAALAGCLFSPAAFAQQQPFVHLNPMVDKLAQGKPVIGVTTGDFSMENAHAIARADVDFVRIEMEHGPMDFEALRTFLIGMIDKAAIMKKGNLQPRVAPIARFSPYGREQQAWVIKQALDIGLMGYIANGVDNKEQALEIVRSMRYPQQKGAALMQPTGLRGYSPTHALWFWGIGSDEYVRRADLWPLNPQGDLISIIMIETVEGLKNVNEIASVPGVGMLFPGAAADLSMSMGVKMNSPEREAALQTVLKACLAHNVPCGILANANDVEKRIQEGWKYLEMGGTGISASADAGLRAARSAIAK